MARNEEKQLGKLNRLWLQKEKVEGHIKDVRENRPRLSSLNTAAVVKKWMPSIKKEIEYYLQQSQLPHYPERKLAEFEQRIGELSTEYKRYFCKLRALDPSCREQPWTPRAYTKKRPQQPDTHTSSPIGGHNQCSFGTCAQSNKDHTEVISHRRREDEGHQNLISSDTSLDQDQPLSFNMEKMPMILARSGVTQQATHTDSFTRVLFSGLPNLQSSPLAQAKSAVVTPLAAPAEAPNVARTPQSSNLLGLDCYSSSSEDDGSENT